MCTVGFDTHLLTIGKRSETMQGLRWRLDPGPTHLDTCTFQVLSDDGAILQYKVSCILVLPESSFDCHLIYLISTTNILHSRVSLIEVRDWKLGYPNDQYH